MAGRWPSTHRTQSRRACGIVQQGATQTVGPATQLQQLSSGSAKAAGGHSVVRQLTGLLRLCAAASATKGACAQRRAEEGAAPAVHEVAGQLCEDGGDTLQPVESVGDQRGRARARAGLGAGTHAETVAAGARRSGSYDPSCAAEWAKPLLGAPYIYI